MNTIIYIPRIFVLALLLFAQTTITPSQAAEEKAIEIICGDNMKFSLIEIKAKAGQSIKITLKNTGKIPKEAMGHNLVLLKKDTDLNKFSSAGINYRATDYIAPEFKDTVLTQTKIIGPNETDIITFQAPKETGQYPYICTFPAHCQAGMKGLLIVE